MGSNIDMAGDNKLSTIDALAIIRASCEHRCDTTPWRRVEML